MRTVNINLIPHKVYLLTFRPDSASLGDDTLLVRSEYQLETDASGNGSIDLPVPASGSLRYEWNIINSNLGGVFYLQAGAPINFEDLIVIGAATTPSIAEYIDAKIAEAIGGINLFTALADGLVPASGGGTVNFLRADGTWQPVLVPDVTAPTAPVLTGATQDDDSILWTWTASSDDVAVKDYILETADDVGFTTNVVDTTILVADPRSHLETGLGPSKTRFGRVKARDTSNNSSAWSNTDSDTTDVSARAKILDTVTIPTQIAAFGFSQIKTAYAGPCVRVINTTTSVQTDVGFDANGNFDITAALALFIAGQQLEIVTYYDLTGGGNHVTAVGTRHKLDLSGHRACAITATSASPSIRYQSSTTVNLTNPACFFVADFYAYGQSAILDFGGGNQMQTRNAGGTSVPGSKFVYMNNGSAITSSESLTYGTQGSDGIRQFTTYFKAGNDRMRRDGIELTVGANAGDTARPGSQICLTDFNGGGGLGWTGRFHEVIILDGTISDPNIVSVENNQMAYYQDGKHVFCVGDSQSYGPTLSNIYTENYAAGIRAGLKTANIRGWDVDSCGLAGYTIQDVETAFPTMVAPRIRSTAQKNVVIIEGYFNNSGTESAATGITRMQSLINTIRAALNPGDEIWLRTCTRATGAGMDDTRIIAFNNLAKAPGAFTNLTGVLDSTADTHLGNAANTADGTYYNADATHLTPAGYALEATYALAGIAF
jgi:hypothetical protein